MDEQSEAAEMENENDGKERIGTWNDLMGSDLQMKVIAQNDSINNPRAVDVGDALYITFEARQATSKDDEVGAIFQDVNEWLVVVGEKDVMPALEMGLRFMREGETSLVYSHSKYAYGPLGRKQGEYILPPNASVVYRVTIKKLLRDTDESFGATLKMEIAVNKKLIGNDCYQFEWSEGYGKGRALQLYNKGAQAMSNLLVENEDEEVQKEALQILVDCLNNIAAVHLKAKEYGKAKHSATQVLLRDPNNMKALLRAARAAIYDPAGTFEESEAAVAAAEQVNPDDSDLQKLKAELSRKKREYKRKSKAMLTKMSKAVKPESKRPETAAASPANNSSSEEISESASLSAVHENGTHDEKQDKGAPLENLPPDVRLETGFWKRYTPYLIQVIMPFIMYYFFTQMKKEAESERVAPLSSSEL